METAEVVATERHCGTTGHDAAERLAGVYRWLAGVHEFHARYVRVQVVVELQPHLASARRVYGTGHALHVVLPAFRDSARHVFPDKHFQRVARVQEVAPNCELRAAGYGTARRSHIRDFRFDEVERLFGPESERGQQLVYPGHVRHFHWAVIEYARVLR